MDHEIVPLRIIRKGDVIRYRQSMVEGYTGDQRHVELESEVLDVLLINGASKIKTCSGWLRPMARMRNMCRVKESELSAIDKAPLLQVHHAPAQVNHFSID